MLRGQIVYCVRCGHPRPHFDDVKVRQCPRCKEARPVWTTQAPVDRGEPLVPFLLSEADRRWLKKCFIGWAPEDELA